MKKQAEIGNGDAQLVLGEMYYGGQGVSKDDAEAVKWWQKAAEQGHAKAQYNLGEIYRSGNPYGDQPINSVVITDNAKAAVWYQKAAARGLARAQFQLGWMYLFGEGVSKDSAKAAEWFKKAATQGHIEAQYRLAVMYGSGTGVPKDGTKAVDWLEKAAAQEHAEAQHRLGNIYSQGKFVPKNDAKAMEWYQKAATQGHVDAQSVLGTMYWLGDGVPIDPVRAYAWLNLAAAQGSTFAADTRNVLGKEMTPAQVAEGQHLASNWKKGDALQAASTNIPGDLRSAGALNKYETGTAFVVSREGHALTNQHVIDACTEVRVTGRGIAKIITSDSVNDLALLQFPGNSMAAASLNPNPATIRQGEDVIVFGYPLNSVLSAGGNLTLGTLSALTGMGNNTNQIQITAPIQPGSSGSPVLDKKGNVIGVVAMKLSDRLAAKATGQIPQNVNFAVNGQTTKAFLDANKVRYKAGSGFFSREKSNADIAEDARKWTVILECWK